MVSGWERRGDEPESGHSPQHSGWSTLEEPPLDPRRRGAFAKNLMATAAPPTILIRVPSAVPDSGDKPAANPLATLLPAARMVLLRHDMPDGSWHFDWLLERPEDVAARGGRTADPNSRVLLSFRVSARIDDAACAGFLAERIAEHRLVYLDFEGDIGSEITSEGPNSAGRAAGTRGRVTRVARGRIWRVVEKADQGRHIGSEDHAAGGMVSISAGFADASGRCVPSEWVGRAALGRKETRADGCSTYMQFVRVAAKLDEPR